MTQVAPRQLRIPLRQSLPSLGAVRQLHTGLHDGSETRSRSCAYRSAQMDAYQPHDATACQPSCLAHHGWDRTIKEELILDNEKPFHPGQLIAFFFLQRLFPVFCYRAAG